MACLCIGYYRDFADPTLLIWGSSEGLLKISTFLSTQRRTAEREMQVSSVDWINLVGNEDVCIKAPTKASRIFEAQREDRLVLSWHIPLDSAKSFAKIVEGVAACTKPCHNYLEADIHSDIEIVVSKGEYDDWCP